MGRAAAKHAEAEAPRPIIIKRVKKGGHAHHGGSWKVAFADFATAMMAFFLLMWLMEATTEEQKGAISEYFNNPSDVQGASPVPSPSPIQGPGGASTSMIKLGGGMELHHDPAPPAPIAPPTPGTQTADAAGRRRRRRSEKLDNERLAGTARRAAQGDRRARVAREVQGPDPARRDARRRAHPDHRSRAPLDVPARQRAARRLQQRHSQGARAHREQRAEPHQHQRPHGQ